MGMSRDNQNIAILAIRDGKTFRTASLKGCPMKGTDPKAMLTGDLPDEYKAEFYGAKIAYVVYSFKTPIAWQTEDGEWVIPAHKYSVTTTQQQNLVRRALQLV